MGKKIMIVDDEPDTVELVDAILGAEGFNVIRFENSEKALDSIMKFTIMISSMISEGQKFLVLSLFLFCLCRGLSHSPFSVCPFRLGADIFL